MVEITLKATDAHRSICQNHFQSVFLSWPNEYVKKHQQNKTTQDKPNTSQQGSQAEQPYCTNMHVHQ